MNMKMRIRGMMVMVAVLVAGSAMGMDLVKLEETDFKQEVKESTSVSLQQAQIEQQTEKQEQYSNGWQCHPSDTDFQ